MVVDYVGDIWSGILTVEVSLQVWWLILILSLRNTGGWEVLDWISM